MSGKCLVDHSKASPCSSVKADACSSYLTQDDCKSHDDNKYSICCGWDDRGTEPVDDSGVAPLVNPFAQGTHPIVGKCPDKPYDNGAIPEGIDPSDNVYRFTQGPCADLTSISNGVFDSVRPKCDFFMGLGQIKAGGNAGKTIYHACKNPNRPAGDGTIKDVSISDPGVTPSGDNVGYTDGTYEMTLGVNKDPVDAKVSITVKDGVLSSVKLSKQGRSGYTVGETFEADPTEFDDYPSDGTTPTSLGVIQVDSLLPGLYDAATFKCEVDLTKDFPFETVGENRDITGTANVCYTEAYGNPDDQNFIKVYESYKACAGIQWLGGKSCERHIGVRSDNTYHCKSPDATFNPDAGPVGCIDDNQCTVFAANNLPNCDDTRTMQLCQFDNPTCYCKTNECKALRPPSKPVPGGGDKKDKDHDNHLIGVWIGLGVLALILAVLIAKDFL